MDKTDSPSLFSPFACNWVCITAQLDWFHHVPTNYAECIWCKYK